jgi:hypothetical protein
MPMQSLRTLPAGYSFCYALAPGKNWAAQALLALVAVAAFFTGWQIIRWVLPLRFLFAHSGIALIDRWGILLAAAVMIVLHENVHALVIWRFTGSWPTYGMSPLGVYVRADGWYFTRGAMIAISAAPLVALTVIGVLVMAIISPALASLTVWFILLNAAGSVNDAAVAAWVFFQPDTALIHNNGRAMAIYRAGPEDCDRSSRRDRIRVLLEKALVKT